MHKIIQLDADLLIAPITLEKMMMPIIYGIVDKWIFHSDYRNRAILLAVAIRAMVGEFPVIEPVGSKVVYTDQCHGTMCRRKVYDRKRTSTIRSHVVANQEFGERAMKFLRVSSYTKGEEREEYVASCKTCINSRDKLIKLINLKTRSLGQKKRVALNW